MPANELPQSEPVQLFEDVATGDRFLIYGTETGVRIELRYEGDTLWLTQGQIADLFNVARQTVNGHILNIYDEGELDREATCREFLQVRTEGDRDVSRKSLIHNLDVIIAVGYRVSTRQGTLFRRWATDKLVQFATKGFVVDVARLKDPDSNDRVAELREIIRDIRSDERNVYRELRRICAMCQDYDGESTAWRDFYQRTQAKLMWAVTSNTPSEIVYTRADSRCENMGLQTWLHGEIRKSDSEVSKNYLAHAEIKELNRLTTILLDIFDDQLDVGRLVAMSDAERLLDQQLQQLSRAVLRAGGSVSSVAAKQHAHQQYAIFNEKRRALRHAQADANLAKLQKEAKTLPKAGRGIKK